VTEDNNETGAQMVSRSSGKSGLDERVNTSPFGSKSGARDRAFEDLIFSFPLKLTQAYEKIAIGYQAVVRAYAEYAAGIGKNYLEAIRKLQPRRAYA